jgi:hypothetical protein
LSQTAGSLLIVAVVAAFFLVSAIWLRFLDSQVHVSGRILPPGEEHKWERPLRVEGELSPVPHGHHVWLAFETRGLLFPVEPELHASGGRFATELAADPPSDPFSLLLVLVGAKGQRAIEYWLLEGGLGDGFPGFDRIPGSAEIDRVRGDLLTRAGGGTPEIRSAPPT